MAVSWNDLMQTIDHTDMHLVRKALIGLGLGASGCYGELGFSYLCLGLWSMLRHLTPI